MKYFHNSNPQNRMEKLRNRREKKSQQRIMDATQYVVRGGNKPMNINPVTVRGASFGLPLQSKPKVKPRKSIYVPLAHTGTELRLGSLPVIRWNWKMLSGMLTLLFMGVLIFLLTSPTFRVTNIQVEGLQHIPKADLEAILDLEDTPIFAINPTLMVDKLRKNFGELTDFRVSVKMPATVNLTLRERQPVIAWKVDKEIDWVDAEGYVMDPRGEIEGLIIVNSKDQPPIMPAPTMTAEQKENNYKELPQIDPLLVNLIMQLHKKLGKGANLVYNRQSGLGWIDENGTSVIIGNSMSDFDAKVALYKAISEQLKNQKVKPSLINVEFLHAPYYRVER
ncbi:MAG TPA: FtsQ-type POTRA domain-containing protein [Anaerolineaceae bacterium]